MKRSVSVVSLILLLAVVCSAATADYSYQLEVYGYNVVVTGLDNGKVFLRLDKELYEARIDPKSKEDTLIRVPKERGIIFAILVDGKTLWIDFPNGEHLTIEVLPPDMKAVIGETINIKDKKGRNYRTTILKGNVGDDEESTVWLFSHRAVHSKTHTIDISQTSQKKEVPAEFKSAISSFRERRIK